MMKVQHHKDGRSTTPRNMLKTCSLLSEFTCTMTLTNEKSNIQQQINKMEIQV